MSVSLNNPITLADFIALAALANSKLLPIVNASVAAGTWPIHEYSVLSSGVLANPQPSYSFSLSNKNWMSELNRIRRDFYNLIYNQIAGGESVYQSQNAVFSGPWVVDVNDPDTFPRFLTYTDNNQDNPVSFPSNSSLNGIFLASGSGTTDFSNYYPCYFRDIAFWFAQNDVPLDDLTITGQTVIGSSIIPIVLIPVSSFTSPTYKFTVTLNAAAAGTVKLHMEFDFRITSTLTFDPVTAPTIADLNIQKSIGCTGTITLKSFTHANDGAGFFVCNAIYNFTGDWSFSAASGANSVWMSFDVPAAYLVGRSVYYGLNSDASVWASKDFDFVTGSVDAAGINPWSATRKMQCTVNGYEKISIKASNGQWYGIAQWALSNPLIKGVWTAKTLPVPGINVYLDQDLPPFVDKISGTDATSQRNYALASYSDPGIIPVASSMKVSGPSSALGENFTTVNYSMAARPTPYEVLRNTDFVPYNFNFVNDVFINLISEQFTNGPDIIAYTSLFVPENATNIKIRAVNKAKLGWKNGVFQYGEPTAIPLTIILKKNSYPTFTDYDIISTNGAITINPDGGGSYLSEILGKDIIYAIYCPTFNDVNFEIVTEIDTSDSFSTSQPSPRNYLPNSGLRESWSYCIGDQPANQSGYYTYGIFHNKKIPQNGYCIFKLRATRLPISNGSGIYTTPSSGNEISLQIGQNRLNQNNTLEFVPLYTLNNETGAGGSGMGAGDDGMGAGGIDPTPYSITIPANSGSSGDIAVFWPVLSGTELIYKCNEQIIVEAWVNWQPIFFNNALAFGLDVFFNNPIRTYTIPSTPINFKNALSYVNGFDKRLSGYPVDPNSSNVSTVQFPISIEIYNDLESCLNLL